MNENERQAMLAAIRAVSSAVDDISAVVADMPGQWAASIAASEKRVSDMETAMQAVAATMAENYVRLNALVDERHELLGGTLTNVTNSFKTFEQIIADNRKDSIAMDSAVHKRVTELTERLDTTGGALETLKSMVGDVQGDVISLRAGGSEFQDQVLESLSKTQDGVLKATEANELNTKSIGIIFETTKALGAQIDLARNAINDQATQVNAANTAHVGQMVEALAEVRESIEAVNKRAGDTAAEVFRLNSQVPGMATKLDEHEETLTIVRGDVVNLQATVNVEHKAAIHALETDGHAYITKSELKADLAKISELAVTNFNLLEGKVGEQIAQLGTQIGGAIEHADIIVTGEAEARKIAVDMLQAAIDKSAEAMLGTVGDVIKTAEANVAQLRTEIGVAKDEVIGLVEQEVLARKELIVSVKETIEKTGTAVSTVSSELKLATSRIDDTLQKHGDILKEAAAVVDERFASSESALAEAVQKIDAGVLKVEARVEEVAKEATSGLQQIKLFVDSNSERLDTTVADLQALQRDVPARDAKMRADMDLSFEEREKALELQLLADRSTATEQRTTLTARVDGLQGLAESAIESVDELKSRVSVVEQVTDADREAGNQRHVEMLSRIQATKDALLPAAIEGAKVSKETLESTILGLLPAMLPEPGATAEQMAELQTKLLAALDSVELPAPKVPKLGFRSAFNDGVLRLTVLQDDQETETISIPVDVGMQYRGVYDAAQPYRTGDFVTHDGSMWVCRDGASAGRPKDGSSGWTLAVKRGKDGHTVKAYDRHEQGNVYKRGDFLRHNNHLWQCTKMTSDVPTGTQRESSETWTLIGGVQ